MTKIEEIKRKKEEREKRIAEKVRVLKESLLLVTTPKTDIKVPVAYLPYCALSNSDVNYFHMKAIHAINQSGDKEILAEFLQNSDLYLICDNTNNNGRIELFEKYVTFVIDEKLAKKKADEDELDEGEEEDGDDGDEE